MVHPNALADIYHSLQIPITVANKHHFLFLYGTHGKFIPKPTIPERYFARGETLSYAILRVASQLGETESLDKKTPGDPLSFCTPSIDVLNGPTTRGTEVGELIAEAIFLVLKAAASGKETLQIAAHSRGAVEAILLMHELGRIKMALAETPEKSLKEILTESPCKLTKAAFIKLFINHEESEDTPENRALLCLRLNALTINAFLIDPVPGDSSYAFTGFNWHDERFYQKPPCHSYVLLLCRDEFSSFFYPVVSKGMQFMLIPGHHGSSLGNLFTQGYLDLPENLSHLKTTDVQDLVLCKLLYFFHQATGILTQPTAQPDFGHSALDPLVNSFLAADEPQKKLILLNLYAEVAKNDGAYRYFTNTHYPYLPRAFAPGNYRYVHLYGPEFKSMPDVQSDFVNPEHALLYLGKYVNFSETHETEADVQVSAITCTLKNIILEMKGISEQCPLLTIISSEPGREIFFNSLSMLVGTISQKYLHEHLSVEEKKRLKAVITLPFTTLSEAKEEIELSGHKDTIEKCQAILQDGFKHTAEIHYNAIVEQANQLQQQVRLFIAPTTNFRTDDQYDVEYYLSKIEQVCSAAEEINQLYPQLKSVIGTKKLEIEQHQLSLLNRDLINLAVNMLKDKAPDLDTKPETVSEAFYDLAKQQIMTCEIPSLEEESAVDDAVSPSMVHLSIRGKSPLFFARDKDCLYIEDMGNSVQCADIRN